MAVKPGKTCIPLHVQASWAFESETPETALSLSLPVPNPASEMCRVSVFLPEPGPVELLLQDCLGRNIKQLYSAAAPLALSQQIRFPVTDLAPGVYILQLQTSYGVAGQRLIISK